MANAYSSSNSTALRDETVLWRARQVGSARAGLREGRSQHLVVVTLIPLAVFLAAMILCLAASHQTVAAWIASPLTVLAITLLVLAGLVHALVRAASAILDVVSTLAVLKLFLDR